ncbi:SRPBCC family protein [Evansella cellulosilytica]|uniref:Cyclase/dehydrase n=1 Tax=Evansella cellulosilytica (strain ATCC 21833 / DSM 2522 / FERM P-1141 / JCM 9156 / N-4) TaxID=649639 RepID=E6U119_EVAC2|nr:cyclase/dehydrase [Evansella cellulosilytica]ADU30331.1 cyclase/dehydrase [Evansella cellulosilytica DSM 2522]
MFKGSYQYKTILRKDIDDTWEFFSSAENLVKITRFPIVKVLSSPKVVEGNSIQLQLHFILFRLRWTLKINKVKENHLFIDEALSSPFPFTKWIHTHTFIEKEGSTIMLDKVEYESYIPSFIIRVMMHGMFRNRKKMLKRYF